jgi:hypothetical protein
VVWLIASGPIAFYGATQLGDRTQSISLSGLHEAARTSAFERAYTRINDDPFPMTTERGLPGGVEVTPTSQRYLELLLRPDASLRAELDAVDREFEPQITEARNQEQETLRFRFGVGWLILALVPFAGGATVAWMRRR